MIHSRTRELRRVVVTGLGLITSIGNDKEATLASLKNQRTGIRLSPDFDRPDSPVRLAGTVEGFHFPGTSVDDWEMPDGYVLSRNELRSMSPNCVYAWCAMQQAIKDAGLTPQQVSNPRTGTMCASGGSMWLSYEFLNTMQTRGVLRCHPMGLVASIPGTLNINLSALYQIRGAALGFASACASSAHAFGHGFDLIQSGRQDIIFAVGAEDLTAFTGLPFAAIRALSTQTDPTLAPRAFDANRDGFVVTGGASVLVLEELEHARLRNAPIYAEVLGWGQSSDGYNVMAPEPDGEGLSRCMELALDDAGISNRDVDYINAHATSTFAGDIAEVRAIKRTFGSGRIPNVSSTKSLTGHGLNLAGALEAAICCLALTEKFTPVSSNITCLDPECEGVPIVTKPISDAPGIAMSNSSGFGGSNVSLILRGRNSSDI